MRERRGIQREEKLWLMVIVAALLVPIVLILVFAATFLFVKRTNEIFQKNNNALEKFLER